MHYDWLLDESESIYIDGSQRIRSLSWTRSQLEPNLSSYGITRVAELTGLDIIGIPIYSAIRPSAATVSVSAGKGLSHDAAWISAVMEAIEVDVSEKFEVQIMHRDSLNNIAPGYSVRDLNLHPKAVIDDDSVINWSGALDLYSRDEVLFPCEAIGLQGWTSETWLPPSFIRTTNGLASGNNLTEATLHGLYELIERDALNRSFLNKGESIDLGMLGERLSWVVNRLADIGTDIEIVKLDSLGETVTFACYLTQPNMPQIFGGSGCHSQEDIALERAVLEAIQSRMSVISGLRDDISSFSYQGLKQHKANVKLRAGQGQLSEIQSNPENLNCALWSLVETVIKHTGAPVLAVNMTCPDSVFPSVVQVFAPGLAASPAMPSPQQDI